MDFDTRDLATTDGDRTETQSLLALPSTRREHNATSSDQVGVYAPAQPNISSDPSESDIWDHFESTRRSANYHLDEYFHFREDVRSEPAPAQPESQGLVDQKRKPPNRSAWRLKVAQDSLLNELETSIHLLDIMSRTAKKGLAKFYVILVLLGTTSKLTDLSTSTVSDVMWASSLVGMVPTASYIAYRSCGWAAINLCKLVVERVHRKTLENTLEISNKNDLKSLKFQALWWMNYFRYR